MANSKNIAGLLGPSLIAITLSEMANIHIWAGNYKPDASKRTDLAALTGQLRFKGLPGDLPDRWLGEAPNR